MVAASATPGDLSMADGFEPEVQQGTDQPAARERVPALIARAFDQASQPLRRSLLALLLRPVGPLALVAIASGAFASFLRRRTWQTSDVSFEDAARITGEQVFELARYVEQASPDLIAQVVPLLAGDLSSVGVVTGLLLLHAVRRPQSDKEPSPDE